MKKTTQFIKKTALLACCVITASASAQEKINIKPTGRILMDGAFFPKKELKGYEGTEETFTKFGNGVAVPDFRIGAKASYKKFAAKIDLGYAYGDLSLKDVFVEYFISKNSSIKGGYFVHQFGLESSTSSSMKTQMSESESNEVFFEPRLVGLMYQHRFNDFSTTLSVHSDANAMKKKTNETGSQGYGFMSRNVYKAISKDNMFMHVGISGAFKTIGSSDYFKLSANYPSRVASVKAIDAKVSDARNMWKFTPEFVYGYGPIGVEAQYFKIGIKRKNNMPGYNASGAYAGVRSLLLGGNYSYSDSSKGIDTPQPGSLEFFFRYNYTDLNDAGVHGGMLNDYTVGFNYYINKYMLCRLKYANTSVKNRAGFEDFTLNSIQARLQIIY